MKYIMLAIAMLSIFASPAYAAVPVANFSANVTSGAVPLSVGFNDSSTNSPTSWFWDFGDGANSTDQNTTHVYSSVGTYNVSLNASNVDGSNISTQLSYITAAIAPVAGFSANATSGPAPLSVLFTDSSTNTPTSWLWDFGDGNTSTAQNPTYEYVSVGTYNVSLNASNAGGSNVSTQLSYITATQPAPVASFSSNVTSGPAPLSVNFTDSSTNSPTDWFWDFGDGTNSTSQNPTHEYTNAGTYNVSLNSSNIGGSNVSTQLSYITASTPAAPVASISSNVTSGTAPLSVLFMDSSTNYPTDWFWDFGDGTNSTDQNPTHTYSSVGIYNVILNASNAVGSNVSTQLSYITVANVPIANFSSNVTSGAVSLPVGFTDLSTNSPVGWAWYFGNEDLSGSWTEVNSSSGWSERSSHTSVVLPDGSIVVMGGTSDGSDVLNDTWRSTDNGTTWTLMNASSGWEARKAHSTVVLSDGTIVLTGGYGTSDRLRDTWRSTDKGATWTEVSSSSGWGGRYWHSSVVLPDDSIVLMGGRGLGTIKVNDTWRSTDGGATWTEVNSSSGWEGRNTHQSAVLSDGSIVLTGGSLESSTVMNDTWRSTDNGSTWAEVNSSSGWSIRRSHSMLALPDSSIVLMGGTDDSTNLNDVWRSTDNGSTWTLINASADWSVRSYHSNVMLPDGSMVLMGGYHDGSTRYNDTWSLSTAGSNEQNPTHTYTAAGAYQVSLQAYNAGGYDSAIRAAYITAGLAPVANFSANVTSGNVPFSVNFTDTSTNSPTAWFWDFGDGTNSTDQNPIHEYTSAGTYNVSLNASNAGGSNVSTQLSYISATQLAPVANFSANVTSGNTPLSVLFTDNSSNNPTTWLWNFGDGNTSTDQNATHIYASTGTYNVSLNASNTAGSNVSTLLSYITVNAPYSGGSGTLADPYLLSTDSDIDELSSTSADWSKNFTLTQNITLVGNHTPIGNGGTQFTGDFDGNGYAVKNLTVYQAGNYAGFFGYTGSGANINDLGVEASSDGVVSTSSHAGVIVGHNFGTVDNSHATGNATVSVYYAGGLVGQNRGTVSNCSATGNTAGVDCVAGLVGYNNGGTVSNSYATGNAIGSANYVGGLLGASVGTVSNSYATGNATGSNRVGGLVGQIISGSVTNSFATGNANGSSNYGGLVGQNSGTVTNSYYSGIPVAGAGTPSSYANFTSFTFVSGASGLNWNAGGNIITTVDDANFIWKIDDGSTLPYLMDAITPGTPTGFTNTAGNSWVNHSWNAGSGNLATDSYNVSYNGSWQNGTTSSFFNHTGLTVHAWSNITVYAYNATNSTLSSGTSDNIQIPNNNISILNVTDITVNEGENVSFDLNFTDADSDTPVFASNNSSLFDSFNTSTGEGLWSTGVSDAGTYHVEFNVSDGYGSVDSQVMTITINNTIAPVANFTASAVSGYAPLSVVFTDNSTNSPTSWFWDFGDGENSTEQNPTHSFSATGTYNVGLNATNIAGSNLSSNMTITVTTAPSSSSSSSSSSSGSSGGGGGGSTGEAYENIETKVAETAFVNKGSRVVYEFDVEDSPIVSVQFDALKNSGKKQTTIEVLKDRSSFATEDCPGEIYKQMNIWVGRSGFGTSDNIENTEIYFKVAKSWVTENNIDPASIRMMHYYDGDWHALSTSKTGEDEEYLSFAVKTTGFSPFTIVGDEIESVTEDEPASQDASEEETVEEPVEEDKKGIPGFSALMGIAVVVLAGRKFRQ